MIAVLVVMACGSDPMPSTGMTPLGNSGSSGLAGAGAAAGGAGASAGGGSGGRGAANMSAGRSGAGSGAAGMTATAGTTATAGSSAGGSGGTPGMMTAGSGGSSPPPPAGDWPAADPAMAGPFQTTVEMNVGPDGMFTMYRPAELTRRHPVITWGNGTGTTPPTYGRMLTRYASHGFIVIASNSMNVGQGTPPPMLAGVTWVLEQDMNSGSPLFEHVDRMHIGATGHSQGAFATSTAGRDERITTIAPIQGAAGGMLHGPALLICGTMDTTVPCSGAMRAFGSITQPVMYAELKAASHTNWIAGGAMHPFAIATTAWFRVHLMGDNALRPMFYGPDCTLCKDMGWVIMQKNMN